MLRTTQFIKKIGASPEWETPSTQLQLAHITREPHPGVQGNNVSAFDFLRALLEGESPFPMVSVELALNAPHVQWKSVLDFVR